MLKCVSAYQFAAGPVTTDNVVPRAIVQARIGSAVRFDLPVIFML
jgi:hypothetical protein